jgi:hypothetical protein
MRQKCGAVIQALLFHYPFVVTRVVEVDGFEPAIALFVTATSLALRTKSLVSPFVFLYAVTRPQTKIARTTRKIELRH